MHGFFGGRAGEITGNPWDFRCKAVEPKGKKPGGVLDVSLWADLEDGSGWESGAIVDSNEMGDAGMCFFLLGGRGWNKNDPERNALVKK